MHASRLGERSQMLDRRSGNTMRRRKPIQEEARPVNGNTSIHSGGSGHDSNDHPLIHDKTTQQYIIQPQRKSNNGIFTTHHHHRHSTSRQPEKSWLIPLAGTFLVLFGLCVLGFCLSSFLWPSLDMFTSFSYSSRLRGRQQNRYNHRHDDLGVSKVTWSEDGYATDETNHNKHKISIIPPRAQANAMTRSRRANVQSAMFHAWNGYKSLAWGYDELRPISGRGVNNWGGMGTTLVDSLDTLWLMGMKDEFWEARDWVRDKLQHGDTAPNNKELSSSALTVSVFETTIRNLGGLLSAYDWSGDRIFLKRADELGSKLLNAFDSPTGIPYGETDLNSRHSFNSQWHSKFAVLSELGTLQLEFRYLAKVTNKREYAKKTMKVIDLIYQLESKSGLYPQYIKNEGSKPELGNNSRVSLGAMGDSFYEYLLKVWLQGGRTEHRYRSMYDRAMDGMHELLLQESTPGGLTYIAEMQWGSENQLDHKMDHLACFMGGNLALGAYSHPNGLKSAKAQRDLKAGKALAYTCYQMYTRTKTGIAPEFVRFHQKKDFSVPGSAPFFILRPETAETLFLLHRLTGDPIYQEWGWQIFRSIEEHCRTDHAYGSLRDVDNPNKGLDDKMESFFLAETLKYLYLLQDPDCEIDVLNKHVFNTEAHPLRMLNQF